MELVHSNVGWRAIRKVGETTASKDAGFRWNPERKRWYAPELTAIQLIDYASEVDQAKLKAQVESINLPMQLRSQQAVPPIAISRSQLPRV